MLTPNVAFTQTGSFISFSALIFVFTKWMNVPVGLRGEGFGSKVESDVWMGESSSLFLPYHIHFPLSPNFLDHNSISVPLTLFISASGSHLSFFSISSSFFSILPDFVHSFCFSSSRVPFFPLSHSTSLSCSVILIISPLIPLSAVSTLSLSFSN